MRNFGTKINSQSPKQCLSQTTPSPTFHNIRLSLSKAQMRKHLFQWIIVVCWHKLELKTTTIEHCLHTFDLFIAKSTFVEDMDQMKLTILSCLFLSSKYEEIYPPVVCDFQYISSYKFSTQDILKKELQILNVIEYDLMIDLTSHKYYHLFQIQMPDWPIFCLPLLPPFISYNQFAKAIHDEEERKQQKNDVEWMVNSVVDRMRMIGGKY